MSKQYSENSLQLDETHDPQVEENAAPTGDAEPSANDAEKPKAKKKLSKKALIIIGAIAIVVIAIAAIVFIPSKFEQVEGKCVHIAGMAETGKGYFKLDTDPEYGPSPRQQDVLDAIKYANEALGFNGSVYSRMLETTALMGRQTEENSKYKVSWTYHPDDGLEVTYEKK